MTTDITWPERYTPGTTDNFVSNEVIVAGLSAADVWPLLIDTRVWPTYYDNVTDIEVPGDVLTDGLRFKFATFGFPPLQAEVLEAAAPTNDTAGRLGWRAWQDGDADTSLDVYHAWIVEDLPSGRVRVLTQESQVGKPAADLAGKRPNPMLNGHQDWLDGLVRAARG
ncbi:SRPBCC domain-containing protein [Curtobacterium sp. 18060]|uniref:SRPBCC domain-containing protein n=1 Tax=Curtobacterium sp. 18060 TaxID=2681408 RepID=UPI00135AAAB6|nr:SRPBCC domain-containing protein [Curtobacterium sp. 18060]